MMSKRQLFSLCLFVFLVSACGQGTETAVIPTASSETAVTPPTPQQPTSAPTPTASPAPTEEPSPLPPPTETASPSVSDLSIEANRVYLYPVPDIYEGDLVTFQILAHVPDSLNADDVQVQIHVGEDLLVDSILGWRNLAGEAIGLYEWVWDTSSQMGDHQITITLDPNNTIVQGDEDPNNNQVTVTATVNDIATLSSQERNASWVTAETNCCIVHVVSETTAYRDLSYLLTEVENAFQQASATLTEPINAKYDVYMVDRVIGQGGYAGQGMVVSYLDRHYASNGLEQVLIHEAVHLLDRQFAPQRIPFLAEGVAVWASGGHYKPENIDSRIAALVEISQYIPLETLLNDFYPVQHEIGYLEAAGFVSYLIKIYGWNQFKPFYTDVNWDDGATLAEAMDLNLQQYFNITLAQAEANWLNHLSQLPYDQTAQDDLATSIRFYDTMRHYQQDYDPTAYFLTAWLPYPQKLETMGNLADLTRHPETEYNITLEVMLKAAESEIRFGNFVRANALLDSVERVLSHNGSFIDPLAKSFFDIVKTATEQGYEVQAVMLDGGSATVQVIRNGRLEIETRTLHLTDSKWVLTD